MDNSISEFDIDDISPDGLKFLEINPTGINKYPLSLRF
jgi:hypothetical protein